MGALIGAFIGTAITLSHSMTAIRRSIFRLLSPVAPPPRSSTHLIPQARSAAHYLMLKIEENRAVADYLWGPQTDWYLKTCLEIRVATGFGRLPDQKRFRDRFLAMNRRSDSQVSGLLGL